MGGEDFGCFATGSHTATVTTPSGRPIQVTFREISVGAVIEAGQPKEDGTLPSEFEQSVRALAAAIVSWDLPQPPNYEVLAQAKQSFFAALARAAREAVGDPLAGAPAMATDDGPPALPAPTGNGSPIRPARLDAIGYPGSPSLPSSPTSTGEPSARSPIEAAPGTSRPG